MPTPNPPISARIAPSINAITVRAWFSIHSCAAAAAGAFGGIGTWRAPVARTNTHSATRTTPIATTTSRAIRSRNCPGSVASSQSSQAGRRRGAGGGGSSSYGCASAPDRRECAVTGARKERCPYYLVYIQQISSQQVGSTIVARSTSSLQIRKFSGILRQKMATIGGRGVADVSYVPGALTAVVGDQCWALVEAAPDSPAVTRIWQQLGQGAAADALLIGLLTDGPPGGIPGFTLLVAGSGQHRLFCRGAVGATVVAAPVDGGDPRAGEGRAAPVRIDGTGLLTWRERVVDNMNRIFLGEPPADTALRLPATSGVLLAGCVIIDLTSAAARDTGSPALDRTKKNIVLYPDTITMTGGPGSLVGQAPAPPTAGSRPMPGDRGPVLSPAPSASFPPDPARPPDAARPPDPA